MSQEVIEKCFCKNGYCETVLYLPQISKRVELNREIIIIIDNRERTIKQIKSLIKLTRR